MRNKLFLATLLASTIAAHAGQAQDATAPAAAALLTPTPAPAPAPVPAEDPAWAKVSPAFLHEMQARQLELSRLDLEVQRAELEKQLRELQGRRGPQAEAAAEEAARQTVSHGPPPEIMMIRRRNNTLVARLKLTDGREVDAMTGMELPGGWTVAAVRADQVWAAPGEGKPERLFFTVYDPKDDMPVVVQPQPGMPMMGVR